MIESTQQNDKWASGLEELTAHQVMLFESVFVICVEIIDKLGNCVTDGIARAVGPQALDWKCRKGFMCESNVSGSNPLTAMTKAMNAATHFSFTMILP